MTMATAGTVPTAATAARFRLHRRFAAVVVAMLPGVVATLPFAGAAAMRQAIAVIALVLAAETLAMLVRHRRATLLALLQVMPTALLLATCLPLGLPLPALAVACLVAVWGARHGSGDGVVSWFTPAMAGVLAVAWLAPDAPAAAQLASWPAVAAVFAGAAMALWRRWLPWQGALAFAAMIAAATTLAMLLAPDASPTTHTPPTLLATPLPWLVAFFAIGDFCSAPATPRGRALAGLAAGTLATIAGAGIAAFAAAALVANLATPWLDVHARPDPPRPGPA